MTAPFDPSRHPRNPAGSPAGGKFSESQKAGPDPSVRLGDNTATAGHDSPSAARNRAEVARFADETLSKFPNARTVELAIYRGNGVDDPSGYWPMRVIDGDGDDHFWSQGFIRVNPEQNGTVSDVLTHDHASSGTDHEYATLDVRAAATTRTGGTTRPVKNRPRTERVTMPIRQDVTITRYADPLPPLPAEAGEPDIDLDIDDVDGTPIMVARFPSGRSAMFWTEADGRTANSIDQRDRFDDGYTIDGDFAGDDYDTAADRSQYEHGGFDDDTMNTAVTTWGHALYGRIEANMLDAQRQLMDSDTMRATLLNAATGK